MKEENPFDKRKQEDALFAKMSPIILQNAKNFDDPTNRYEKEKVLSFPLIDGGEILICDVALRTEDGLWDVGVVSRIKNDLLAPFKERVLFDVNPEIRKYQYLSELETMLKVINKKEAMFAIEESIKKAEEAEAEEKK